MREGRVGVKVRDQDHPGWQSDGWRPERLPGCPDLEPTISEITLAHTSDRQVPHSGCSLTPPSAISHHSTMTARSALNHVTQ
eukprot:3838870-Rhodomonas_salina.1